MKNENQITTLKNWQAQLKNLLRNHVNDWEPLYSFLIESDLIGLVEFEDGEWICQKGDAPDVFWLIIDGQVDICSESGTRFKGRRSGELIGEQSFLLASQPGASHATRSAGMRAHGSVKLVTFNGNILSKMDVEIKSFWFEFLGHLINEKLIEASDERGKWMDERIAKSQLLRRLCSKEALSLVQMAVEGKVAQSPIRETVVWFSDIAGFSTWSKGRNPNDVAVAMSTLLGLQANLIHDYGGDIDKFMGDGLMAFWFISDMDTNVASRSVRCASHVIRSFKETILGTDMESLSLRIGLHCGDTCFGDFGTSDRIAVTLLGEPVNLAARYEQLRESEKNPGLGPVRISDQLYERIAVIDKELTALIKGPQSAEVKDDNFLVYWIEVK